MSLNGKFVFRVSITRIKFFNFRGDSFRREFKNLGEVRSIIPPHVHIMGMTATATRHTKDR